MALFFFDASALVKRYIREPGSDWVRNVCDARDDDSNKVNRVAIAEISRVEVAAAFAVLVRRNEISKNLRDRAFRQFTDEIAIEYRLLRLTPAILRNAADLTQRYPLKAYDAVQLATALVFDANAKEQALEMTFVSGDEKLLESAGTEGLTTDNPFSHTDLG